MLAWCRKHPEAISTRHVKLFKQATDAASFLRSIVVDSPQLLSAAVDVLSKMPTDADRATFVRGLGADRLQTQKNSAIGLRRLLDRGAESLSFDETQAAVATISKLGNDAPDQSVRKQLALLLRASFGKEPQYPGVDLIQTRQFLEKKFGQQRSNRKFGVGAFVGRHHQTV